MQMTADGAVQAEGDGDESEQSYASGVQRTRPEAPCRGQTPPMARIEACFNGLVGGSSVSYE
jgi:hypothetical protein